jgi:hypothetical protein
MLTRTLRLAACFSVLCLAATASAQVNKNCINTLTKSVLVDTLEYSLGRDKLLPVSVRSLHNCWFGGKIQLRNSSHPSRVLLQANKKRYTCATLQDLEAGAPESAWFKVDQLISTALTTGYLPAFEKEDQCLDEGQDYCCPDGIKHYYLEELKACDLNDGEKAQYGNYKITAREDSQGGGVGLAKVSTVIKYVCNGEARQRTVALRFNSKYYGRCK